MIFYTDGACNPNPGPCGIGVAMVDGAGVVIASISRAIGNGTNNIAEYEAAIAAFNLAREHKVERPDVRTDSQLIVRQVAGEYTVSERLQVLHTRLVRAVRVTGGTLTWIPREENTIADALSKRAIAPSAFPEDISGIVAQTERALAAKDLEPALRELMERVAAQLGESPADAGDALVAFKMGRSRHSTSIEDVARLHARIKHGPDAVELMEAGLEDRSPATRLKALRWAARGLAPVLCVVKLTMEKALTTPYRR